MTIFPWSMWTLGRRPPKISTRTNRRKRQKKLREKLLKNLDINTDQSEEKTKKLREKLLKNLDINKVLDLSEKVSIWVGDITKLEIDAIVNAANRSLLGGGGVDGAIHRAAGKMLLNENKTLNGCDTGEAKLSGGYRLPAKYVISTVGPQGEYPEKLEQCYENSLKLLVDQGLRSIAFPCISTGVYGYPNDKAANVALRTTRRFLEEHHEKIDRVIFCLFLKVDVGIYEKRMPIIFPITEDTPASGEDEDKSDLVKGAEASASDEKCEEKGGEEVESKNNGKDVREDEAESGEEKQKKAEEK